MSFFRPTLSALKSDAAQAVLSGDDTRALTLYRAAAKAEPRNPMHNLRAGDCLVRLGRIPEAVGLYRSVAERYAADAQYARAVSVYRIVQRLAPNDPIAPRRLGELDRIRQAREVREREDARAEASLATVQGRIEVEAVSDAFPVMELDNHTPVPATRPPATPELVTALEATIRELLAELLRTQCELDALRARGSRPAADEAVAAGPDAGAVC